RKLADAAKELLIDFRSYANSNLTFSFTQPGKGLPDSLRYQLYDSLHRMGIGPVPDRSVNENEDAQSERLEFPSAIARYKDYEIPIDLQSSKSGMTDEARLNYSENLLEYKFAEAIHKLTRKRVPVVAYAVGNGQPLPPTTYDLVNTLRNNYRLGVLD